MTHLRLYQVHQAVRAFIIYQLLYYYQISENYRKLQAFFYLAAFDIPGEIPVNQKTASRAKSKKTGEIPSIKELETSSSIMFSRFSSEKLRQASYFDHKSFRFNSVDPVINKIEALYNPQRWNLYAFCGNNPVTYFDPDGRDYDNMWLFGAERARIYREHGDKAGAEYDEFMMESWAEAAGMAIGVGAAVIGILHESCSEKEPEEPYNRRKHYGNTPKKSDRKHFGAGKYDVVDHDPPLVKRYYEGDSSVGEKPGFKINDSDRKKGANDRSRMKLQKRKDSNVQGGKMSAYSKKKKKEHKL